MQNAVPKVPKAWQLFGMPWSMSLSRFAGLQVLRRSASVALRPAPKSWVAERGAESARELQSRIHNKAVTLEELQEPCWRNTQSHRFFSMPFIYFIYSSLV